jgi:hypothetical protein
MRRHQLGRQTILEIACSSPSQQCRQWLQSMAGIKQSAPKSVQVKQIEDFCAFRRKLGKTQKFRRFYLIAARPVLANRH